mmetsp:Transcript_41069/g.63229  ORF Transcript_41069/g.63229 Transcript_41069/m.63229 type:complete len:283 (+) Transcript_41069:77-925(+)
MTITIKKAGEKVASKVIGAAHASAKAAAAKTAADHPTMDVGAPRAIGQVEAPHYKPAKESHTHTMMPWRGWIDRFLQDKMTSEQYEQYRDTFHFMPSDPNDMQQVPFADRKTVVSEDGKTAAAIREVSPGSQPAVDIPLHELDDDPYDSKYFSKDTRRRFVDPEFPHPDIEQIKLDMQDPDDPEVQEAKKKLAAGPPSSPGNGLRFATGPSDFDPTGLRAVMAVTHAEIEKEMENHMPNHLPEPVWRKNEEELFNWYKERDLPLPMGGTWNYASKSRRVARW